MKPEESKKGLNLSKKTKIIMTIIGTIAITILLMITYAYANHVGKLRGYNEAIGTEGICERLQKEMDGEHCQLNQKENHIYKHYLNCTWGNYIVYGEHENKLMNIDPRMIVMQCERTHRETIQ